VPSSVMTAYLQQDTLTRDDVGRVVAVEDGVASSTQCYAYDGFNRLHAAWTTGDPCGEAPEVSDTFWQVDATSYATTWYYTDSGRISSIVNLTVGASSTTSEYAYTDASHPNAVTAVTTGAITDEFTYDDAGRQISRVVDGVSTDLSWDVLSNLVETDSAGGHVLYVYDAGGQRVVKVTLDPDPETGPGGSATAYLGATEVTDPDTSVNHTTASELEGTDFVTGTRFYTFGGATVAVREASPASSTFSLLLGDVQGSAQVMMQVTLDSGGAMEPAATTDSISRSVYLPYGAVRDTDGLSIDRGWLNQVSDGTSTDGGTGLIYLNARYYDPVLSRFLSPDPLMNPSDPKTLDPYRYAENNPVTYTDSTGLCSTTGNWSYVGGVLEPPCNKANGSQYSLMAPVTADHNHGDSGHAYTRGDALSAIATRNAADMQRIADEDVSLWDAFKPMVTGVVVGIVVGALCLGAAGATGGAALVGCGALAGGFSGGASYAVGTPRDQWSWGGFGLSVGIGVASGAAMGGLQWGANSIASAFPNSVLARPIFGRAGTSGAADSGGIASVLKGQAGEDAVRGAYDIGPKATEVINGRPRIFDGLTDTTVSEVKNVVSQSLTQQLRDDINFAQNTGRQFDLYVRPDTYLTRPLQDAIANGDVVLRYIP